MAAAFTHVQFIGYAIPTTPHVSVSVGFPSYVEGRYVGMDPPLVDIGARIELTMHAVERTLRSGAVDPSPSTLKVFVMPEFSFRGKWGAYDDVPFDYLTFFRSELARIVADPVFEGWLFIFGTIVNATGYIRDQNPNLDAIARVRENLAVALANTLLTAQNANDTALANYASGALGNFTSFCQTYPLYTVTDTTYVAAGGVPDPRYPEGLTVEKEFLSCEDFVLNLYGRAFGEEDVKYPCVNNENGENKESAWDDLSIFTIHGIRFGIEICLDHACHRLRSNKVTGTEHVQIQIVPSCGMQIVQSSVVAAAGGLVFNCDGQYGAANASNAICWPAASGQAHTQIAQVVTPCVGNVPGTDDAVLTKPDALCVRTLPMEDLFASSLYAYGAGEVHVYSRLPIPPLFPEG